MMLSLFGYYVLVSSCVWLLLYSREEFRLYLYLYQLVNSETFAINQFMFVAPYVGAHFGQYSSALRDL
jgi:hypothetical protein